MNHVFYTGLFDTKGMEYIIVIAFLLVLIPFWVYINNSKKVAQSINRTIGSLTDRIFNLPQGIYFSKTHTWAFMEKSGVAKVGLNDFLASIIGKVKINLLKNPGETVDKGEMLAEMQQGNKRLMIVSPVSGTVMQINERLKDYPELINHSNYETGWLYGVKPNHWKNDINSFLLAENATRWILEEVNRFKDFLAVTLVGKSKELDLIAYQEGGELREKMMADLDEKVWNEFQKSFLA
jgi:glycine cleavage system H protein